MIKIETFMMRGGELISIDEFAGPLLDEDYVEGAITLCINHKAILTKEQWDYIDQLWTYLVCGLCEIEHGNPYEVYFPDQPIKISLIPNRQDGNIKIRVESGKQEVEATTSLDSFMTEMIKAARGFFSRIRELLPKESYSQILSDLENLSRQRAANE